MNLNTFSLLLTLLLTLSPFAPTQVAEADKEKMAVKGAVKLYFEGLEKRDVESLKKAFHPDAKLIFVKEGQLKQLSQEQWYEGFKAKPDAASPPVKVERKISSIDVAGDAAVVKVEIDAPAYQFTDYLSLIKSDGRWQIVNKVFHRKDKVTASN